MPNLMKSHGGLESYFLFVGFWWPDKGIAHLCSQKLCNAFNEFFVHLVFVLVVEEKIYF